MPGFVPRPGGRRKEPTAQSLPPELTPGPKGRSCPHSKSSGRSRQRRRRGPPAWTPLGRARPSHRAGDLEKGKSPVHGTQAGGMILRGKVDGGGGLSHGPAQNCGGSVPSADPGVGGPACRTPSAPF